MTLPRPSLLEGAHKDEGLLKLKLYYLPSTSASALDNNTPMWRKWECWETSTEL